MHRRPIRMNMKLNSVFIVLIGIHIIQGYGYGCSGTQPCLDDPNEQRPISTMINRMQDAAKRLHALECDVIYTFEQPLLESRTVQTGSLYYACDERIDKLRIHFNTIKQDMYEARPNRQEYIFDGVWLTHIDFHLKNVRKQQLAEPNRPIKTLELVKKHFPLIGFGALEALENEYQVSFADDMKESNGCYHLHLIRKQQSNVSQEYANVELWINPKTWLPDRIEALSVDEELYIIDFIQMKINETLTSDRFDVTIPTNFGEPDIIPLPKETRAF